MKEPAKILVVDDDVDVIDQLTMILEAAGYEVVSAESQADGEKLLATFQPAIAIVDLMMEHMDSGFVLAHRIKARYPQTGVIIMTAVAAETGLEFDSITRSEKNWLEADRLLDKPVRPEQIIGEIESLLAR